MTNKAEDCANSNGAAQADGSAQSRFAGRHGGTLVRPLVSLAPCPFCGSTTKPMLDAFRDYGGEDMGGFRVVCDATGWDVVGEPKRKRDPQTRGCGAQTGYEDTQAEAVAAWNQRAGST